MKRLFLAFAMLLSCATITSAQERFTAGDVAFEIPAGWKVTQNDEGTWLVPPNAAPNEAYLFIEDVQASTIAGDSFLQRANKFARDVNTNLSLATDNRQDPVGLMGYTGIVNVDGIAVRLNLLIRRIDQRVFVIGAIGPEQTVNGLVEVRGKIMMSMTIAKPQQQQGLNSVFGGK